MGNVGLFLEPVWPYAQSHMHRRVDEDLADYCQHSIINVHLTPALSASSGLRLPRCPGSRWTASWECDLGATPTQSRLPWAFSCSPGPPDP